MTAAEIAAAPLDLGKLEARLVLNRDDDYAGCGFYVHELRALIEAAMERDALKAECDLFSTQSEMHQDNFLTSLKRADALRAERDALKAKLALAEKALEEAACLCVDHCARAPFSNYPKQQCRRGRAANALSALRAPTQEGASQPQEPSSRQVERDIRALGLSYHMGVQRGIWEIVDAAVYEAETRGRIAGLTEARDAIAEIVTGIDDDGDYAKGFNHGASSARDGDIAAIDARLAALSPEAHPATDTGETT